MNEWTEIWLDNCDGTKLTELCVLLCLWAVLSALEQQIWEETELNLRKINWDKLCSVSWFSIPDNLLPDGSQSAGFLFSKAF